MKRKGGAKIAKRIPTRYVISEKDGTVEVFMLTKNKQKKQKKRE